jgi:hypothetical protein
VHRSRAGSTLAAAPEIKFIVHQFYPTCEEPTLSGQEFETLKHYAKAIYSSDFLEAAGRGQSAFLAFAQQLYFTSCDARPLAGGASHPDAARSHTLIQQQLPRFLSFFSAA